MTPAEYRRIHCRDCGRQVALYRGEAWLRVHRGRDDHRCQGTLHPLHPLPRVSTRKRA